MFYHRNVPMSRGQLNIFSVRMVGAVYGRIVGRLMVTLFGVHQAGYWEWMDPGAFALIGAASFFGGVTRLTLATTVIMVTTRE